MTPERLEELRALRIDGPLPHPIVIRDELLEEVDRLRGIINHNLKYQLQGERTQGKTILYLMDERDQLKAENEYLRSNTSSVVEREANIQLRSQLAVAREALEEIRRVGYTGAEYIARQALEKLSGGEK